MYMYRGVGLRLSADCHYIEFLYRGAVLDVMDIKTSTYSDDMIMKCADNIVDTVHDAEAAMKRIAGRGM